MKVKIKKKVKPVIKFLKVVKTVGLHSWVEVEIDGVKSTIRKENKNIPPDLLQ